MGRLSLRVADARHEFVAHHVQWHDEQSAGARWILQGDEQERENRTVGVKVPYRMLATTTLWPCEGAHETRAQ